MKKLLIILAVATLFSCTKENPVKLQFEKDIVNRLNDPNSFEFISFDTLEIVSVIEFMELCKSINHKVCDYSLEKEIIQMDIEEAKANYLKYKYEGHKVLYEVQLNNMNRLINNHINDSIYDIKINDYCKQLDENIIFYKYKFRAKNAFNALVISEYYGVIDKTTNKLIINNSDIQLYYAENYFNSF